MSMTPDEILKNARRYRQISDRMEQLSEVIGWIEYCTRTEAGSNYDMNVSWNLGRAIPGYHAVEMLATKQLTALLPNVLQGIAQQARAELAELLKDVKT